MGVNLGWERDLMELREGQELQGDSDGDVHRIWLR